MQLGIVRILLGCGGLLVAPRPFQSSGFFENPNSGSFGIWHSRLLDILGPGLGNMSSVIQFTQFGTGATASYFNVATYRRLCL